MCYVNGGTVVNTLSSFLYDLFILSNLGYIKANSELGASLFEIAQSLFALERTFILGVMALNKNKSDKRIDKIKILSGSLMSDIRTKERSKNG